MITLPETRGGQGGGSTIAGGGAVGSSRFYPNKHSEDQDKDSIQKNTINKILSSGLAASVAG